MGIPAALGLMLALPGAWMADRPSIAAPPSPASTPLPLGGPLPPVPLLVLNAAQSQPGMPPAPPGWDIGYAAPGELPEGAYGGTDWANKTILISAETLQNTIDRVLDPSFELLVHAISEVLKHEYQHTEIYGIPSYDEDGNLIGYNVEFCQHYDMLFPASLDSLCALISSLKDSGSTPLNVLQGLCWMQNDLVGKWNSMIPFLDRECSGPSRDLRFGCSGCTGVPM